MHLRCHQADQISTVRSSVQELIFNFNDCAAFATEYRLCAAMSAKYTTETLNMAVLG